MSNSYKIISDYLKTHRVDVKNTNIFRFIKQHFDKEIFIRPIESMSNKNNPRRIRIRSDKFLELAKLKQEAFLISGLTINEQKFIMCFNTKSFFNYSYSSNMSNSFINFEIDKISNLIKYNNNIQTYIKKDNKVVVFFSCLDEEFDFEEFNKYLKLINQIQNEPEQLITTNKYDKSISDKTKSKIENIYQLKCAVKTCTNHCLLAIDWNQTLINIKDVNLTLPYEFHHFLPKKYFKNRSRVENINSFLDWDIINNWINIVPLCELCHKSIHNSDQSLVNSKFDDIIECYKANNLYELFEDYLMQNSDLDINDLKDLYLNKSNSQGKKYE